MLMDYRLTYDSTNYVDTIKRNMEIITTGQNN